MHAETLLLKTPDPMGDFWEDDITEEDVDPETTEYELFDLDSLIFEVSPTTEYEEIDVDPSTEVLPHQAEYAELRLERSWGCAVCSLIVPGSGQVLQGRTLRGFLFFALAFFTCSMMGLVNIFSAIDVLRR
jgi:hypothetical protein